MKALSKLSKTSVSEGKRLRNQQMTSVRKGRSMVQPDGIRLKRDVFLSKGWKGDAQTAVVGSQVVFRGVARALFWGMTLSECPEPLQSLLMKRDISKFFKCLLEEFVEF